VAYLIEAAAGLVLVDAGLPGSERGIWARVRALGYRPGDVQLIVLTHAHFDHCACLPALLRSSGALLAAHPRAAERFQGKPVPLAQGRRLVGLAMAAGYRLVQHRLPNPKVDVDVRLTEGMDLAAHGLPATVLHTPGHTVDSITLLLEGRRAFVGDLMVGRGRYASPQPYLIEDEAALAQSIGRLRAQRPRAVYTGHSAHAHELPRV
jgi:glyoxylase-like metal-dependent hydrolase (beta-lactamase superfamily II)